ncbi:bile-acid 7-alpha-dehydratase [Prauserella marina]|nr:nuclear transport factor 2 family protein [Prauserella marina]ASR39716.1 bile-acid 7-alpha-dehydratase [Prauserella marina]
MDIATLSAIEEIKRVKYRYLRCVDLKDWDELAGTLAPDVTANYGTPAMGEPLNFTGRTELIDFLSTTLDEKITTVHAAGQPEIDIEGTRAHGVWSFQDKVIAKEHKVVIEGAAFYEDSYVFEEQGGWLIRHTGYTRTYEATYSFESIPGYRLTSTPGRLTTT